MPYLLVKYQEPETFSLMDLTEDHLDAITSGLNELATLYERLGATDDDKIFKLIHELDGVIHRRFGPVEEDDDDA